MGWHFNPVSSLEIRSSNHNGLKFTKKKYQQNQGLANQSSSILKDTEMSIEKTFYSFLD